MEDAGHHVESGAEEKINFHSHGHVGTVLSSLEEQRKKDFLCDITLMVEDVQFRAHKALLAASSEYFSMMFADEGNIGQSVYVIEGIVSEVFESLLQFMYTGNVRISEKSLKQIVSTAHVLKIDNLVKAYIEYQQELLKPPVEVSDNKSVDEADEHVSKRKRGRPKKHSDQTNTQTEKEPENAYIPETMEETCYSNGNMLHEHEVADFAAEVICDLNPKPPEEQIILSRQSKRRSRRTTKLKDYKSGEDNEDREPAKPTARRKKLSASEYSCKDCGKVFKYKHFLVMHRRIHTGECPFTCAECGKGFAQKHSLRVHERIHTGERPYSCTVCSKSLSTKNSLMEHMRIHAEKKSFTCDKCGKVFSQKRQLKSHYRIHIGDGLRDCQICQRTFMDSAQLKKHLRSHTGEKPYTCEVCGKSFTARSSLLTHMRIHRGEKPYTCNICGKAFSDSSAKRRHMTLHTGEKPYACSDCNIQFTRQDNLKAHIKSHNRVRKPRAPPPVTRLSLEAKRIIQMQKEYQLAKRNGQEIQYLVTEHVRNLNFMPGQSIVTAEAAPANVDKAANLTVITHQPPVLRGSQVAPHQQHVQPSHNINLVESRIHTVLPEQMHVVTLPKEVFEQLQGRTHEIHLAQKNQPVTRVLSQPVSSISNQGVRVPQHALQTVAVAAVTQPVPSNPIPAQSSQIQSGAVSLIHTTTATPNSTTV